MGKMLEESSGIFVSKSWRRLPNKSTSNLTTLKIICKSKYQRGHSQAYKTWNYFERKITFEKSKSMQRFLHNRFCLQLKTFGALWLQQFMPARSHKHWWHSNIVFGNLGNQFLWQLCKISSVQCLTNLIQSSEKGKHCSILTFTYCLEVWRYRHVIVQLLGAVRLGKPQQSAMLGDVAVPGGVRSERRCLKIATRQRDVTGERFQTVRRHASPASDSVASRMTGDLPLSGSREHVWLAKDQTTWWPPLSSGLSDNI